MIGSFLRKDHPLLSAKLRSAVRRGASLSLLHGADDDLLMPVANKLIAAPGDWVAQLGEVAVAIAQSKNISPCRAGQPAAIAHRKADRSQLAVG